MFFFGSGKIVTKHGTGILQKSDGKHSKTIHGKGILQKSDRKT